MIGELADHTAAGPADRHSRQKLGLQEPNHEPDTRAPGKTVPPHVVARAHNAHLTVLVVLHEDHTLNVDLLGLNQGGHRVEIPLCDAEVLVGADEDVKGVVTHGCILYEVERGLAMLTRRAGPCRHYADMITPAAPMRKRSSPERQMARSRIIWSEHTRGR